MASNLRAMASNLMAMASPAPCKPRLLRLGLHPELLGLGRAPQGRVAGERVLQTLRTQEWTAQELRGHPAEKELGILDGMDLFGLGSFSTKKI